MFSPIGRSHRFKGFVARCKLERFYCFKRFFSEQVNSICTLAYRVIRIGKCDQILNLFTYPKCHSIPFISDGFGTMIANKELHLIFF